VSDTIITINGKQLTRHQAMTVRFALTSLEIDMDSDSLGDDQESKKMTAVYKGLCNEIKGMF